MALLGQLRQGLLLRGAVIGRRVAVLMAQQQQQQRSIHTLHYEQTNRYLTARIVDRDTGRSLVIVSTREPDIQARLPRRKLRELPSSLQSVVPTDERVRSLVFIKNKQQARHRSETNNCNSEAALLLGEVLAARAAEQGIEHVSWLRPGRYHGKLRIFMDAVADSGLLTIKTLDRNKLIS